MIQVEHLTKYYGKNPAVTDVSFTVEDGHIYGLLGPNGAGKSTIMNTITGLLTPTEGVITINGHIMGVESKEAKKCIGYLPEIPPLYQDMDVTEYLNFVGSLKKIDKHTKNESIADILVKTGLQEVQYKLIKHLSKGYRQRVGIAGALIGNPDIIILDEPTVGLDPEQIIEIRNLIKSLKEEHTVIISSHILSEIAAICDECLVISHGRVVASDTTDTIINSKRKGVTFDFTAKGSKDAVEKVLSKIDKIENYKFIEENASGVKFNVESKEGEDVREELSFALSDARILILELSVSKTSLEDSYLEIMKDFNEELEEEERRLMEEALAKKEDDEDDEDDDETEESDDSDESSDEEGKEDEE
jgi:ABC-2 type transport system ATP-binding protein